MKAIFLLLVIAVASLGAAIDSKVDQKPVHEAFFPKTTSLLPIEVIPKRPPLLREEKPPAAVDSRMIWIEGYWAWDREKEDFIWVCGIWRLPPPNLTWVPGFWDEDNGWFWVGGMWHPAPSNALFAKELPPENPEEEMGPPPGEGYFWASGYWDYNPYEKNFRWMKGSWLPFQEKWVYVPGAWQYRHRGYSFRPPFWDYPLEDRGVAFDCNQDGSYIPLSYRTLISRIFTSYPDYASFFSHHYHFNPQFWDQCWCTPSWWNWPEWWSYNYLNQWALWWWWSHPGFNAPSWLDSGTAVKITAPENELVELLKGGKGPIFMAPKSVPSQENWVKAIIGTTEQAKPLLPEADWAKAIAKLPVAGDPIRPAGEFRPSSPLPKPVFAMQAPIAGIAVVPALPQVPKVEIPAQPKVVGPEKTHPAPEIKSVDPWGKPLKRPIPRSYNAPTWIEKPS